MDKRLAMTAQEQKKVMLNIMTQFARICEEKGFEYFIDAGTLLGAVRHKGYIPWDDDVDVNMPREDFNRFISLIKGTDGYITEHLRVEMPEDTIYPFVKISDDRTILVEFPSKYPMEVGVYIDLFTKDGILDDSLGTKLICKASELLGLMQWFNKFSCNAWKNNGNVAKKIVAAIGRRCIKNPNLPVCWQNKLICWNQRRHPIEKCKYVTTLTNGEFHKRAPKECFSDFIMMDFEGGKFRAPVGYDKYLRCLYSGDYMQLPPEDKRVHHNTIVYWKSEEDRGKFLKELQNERD